MNAFQISSGVTGVKESRADSGLAMHGVGEHAAVLVTPAESVKEGNLSRRYIMAVVS